MAKAGQPSRYVDLHTLYTLGAGRQELIDHAETWYRRGKRSWASHDARPFDEARRIEHPAVVVREHRG